MYRIFYLFLFLSTFVSCPIHAVVDSRPVIIWASSPVAPDETVMLQVGIFYTSEDLALWRHRAANGPFKSKGDAFENSPGDWNRMVNDAKTFLNSDRDNMVRLQKNKHVTDLKEWIKGTFTGIIT